MLKSDLSYEWRRVESRAFSNAATGIANPPAAATCKVARGQYACWREPISRLPEVPRAKRKQHDDVHLALSFQGLELQGHGRLRLTLSN
jgi:hypothetical protein